MDSTTRQRYISTSIWSDEWFDSISTLEKLIYFHLLTNEFTNAAGVYHFSLKQIRTDLDISRDEVNAAMEKFEAAGKAYFFEEYIVIPKWLKHQKISDRNKIFLGVLAILRGLPDEIKRFIADRRHYDFPVEKYMQIPSIIYGPCPVEDGPPPETAWPMPKKGVGHTKNTGNSAHDLDLDLDLDSDSDLDINSGGSLENLSSREENPPGPEPPPPQNIITLSEKAGFPLDAAGARKVAGQNLDPAWLTGQFNFLEYLAEVVKAKCPKNPKGMFFEAIGWQDVRPGFLPWRKKREAGEREKIAAHARDHPPEVCPGCGGAMYGHRCDACGGFVEFRPEKLVWDFIPPGGFDLAGDFRDKIRGKGALDKLTEGLDF
ncbi:MAG: hypothetical protein LBK02_08635 [Treponema sp.]|jgi:hypothetical protein|nr:hypothetical protein [Treponema sp.]